MQTYSYTIGGKPKTSLSKDDIAIITKITSEFIDRSRQDIVNWRDALESADNPIYPRWQPLQDLYEYLSTDGHYASQMDIRKSTLASKRGFIKDGKTGKENADKTKVIKKKWFKNLIKDLAESIAKAYTGVQLDVINGKYDLLPRRNFIPQMDVFLFQSWGTTGVKVDDPSFNGTVIWIKNQNKFGILNDIVPDLIWKKNARQAWAEFSERFGMPMVTATTNKTDQKSLDRLEAQLKSLSEAARAVLPEGTVVKIDESGTKGDPYKTYLEQIKYCDEIISKRILGGTMVSDDGSSRSQAEVHERTRDWIIGEDDRTDIEFTINDQVIPLLVKAGMLEEGDEFVFDRSEDLSTTQHWAIVKDALQIYEIDEEWVASTFQIPIKGRKAPTQPPTPPEPQNDPENDPNEELTPPAPPAKKKAKARASFFA